MDSTHKDVLSIFEELKNILVEHHSKYLESKRNKDTSTEKLLGTPSYVTLVTQKDDLPSNDSPSGQWMTRRYEIPYYMGYMEVYFPKSGYWKSDSFQVVPITNMYDHLKLILKRNPEFFILYNGTNDTSKYTPNEIVNKVLALKRLVAIRTKSAKLLFQH